MQDDIYWNPMVPELSVSEFSRSLDFYCRLLGFTIVHQRSYPDFAYLALGRAQLMLEQVHDGGWNSAVLCHPFGRGINLQIEVDDIAPLYQRVSAEGISLFRELRESWYPIGDGESGQLEFLLQDPDGYLLRFCQYLASRDKAE